MRPTPIHKAEAFTRIELIVVILVVFVLLAMIIQATDHYPTRAPRMSCCNNLKQIAIAYCMWEDDNGDRLPAAQSVAKGGWGDILTNADQGFLCWTNYAIMASYLGQSPKVVICPSDERKPADPFSNFANTNVSYFVVVSASHTQRESLLAGDRNLGPGTKPGPDYGFSPENGKGNDVAIPTNSQVCWSLKMHSLGKSAGAGNILLGDGSVQQCTSAGFCSTWLSHANPTTNWPVGHVPSSPSIRLLFP
jgi:hypothetical protein